MKTKPPISAIVALVLGCIMVGTLAYIISPVLSFPGQEPLFNIPKINQTAALTAVIICLIGLPILALIGIGAAWYRRKEMPWNAAICGGMSFLMLYVTGVMGINLATWATTPKTVLWSETARFTPEETAAGKTYLKTVLGETQATTPEEFQQTLTPLLKLNKWGFIADDPTLYIIQGIKGEPGNKVPKWEYVIPLGNSKSMATQIIESAEADIAKGDTKAATEKAAFVLGVGNRIASPQTLIHALISNHITSLGIKFLEGHPELATAPAIAQELKAVQKNKDLITDAFQEEHKILMRRLEGITFINGKLSPYATITNPQVWEKFHKDWWTESKKEKGDWNQFITNHKWEAFFKAGPIQSMFIGIIVASPNGIYEREKITSKVDVLLQGKPSGWLNGSSTIQIAAIPL